MTDPQNLSGRPPEQPSSDPSAPIYGDVPRYGYQQSGASRAGIPDCAASAVVPTALSATRSWSAALSAAGVSAAGQQPYADQPHGGQPYPIRPMEAAVRGPAYEASPTRAGYLGRRYPVPVYPYAPWLGGSAPTSSISCPADRGDSLLHRLLHLVDQLGPAGEPPAGRVVPDFTAGLGWMAVGGACCWRRWAGRSTTAGSWPAEPGSRSASGSSRSSSSPRPPGSRSAPSTPSCAICAHPRRHRLHRLSLAALGRQATDIRGQTDEDRGARCAGGDRSTPAT